MDRYPITLEDRLKERTGALGFDKDSCMDGLVSAMKHIHTLGLARNDLNPENIVLDEHESPVIIDLGSCQPFGYALITAGTREWREEDFETSEVRHDQVSLGKIRSWMEDKVAT